MSTETNSVSQPKTVRDFLGISARGFLMGSADVVPGVSGGTIAFVVGIYEALIDAINAVNLEFARRLLKGQWRAAFADFPWQFLLALGIGIGAAVLTMAHFLTWALARHETLVWGFFFGLIVASILVVLKRVRRWTPAAVLVLLGFAAAMYWLVGVTPHEMPHTPLFLFLSGAVAICAMILPGISGAFILVLLGQYHYVLEAVVTQDWLTLIIVGAGCAVGLLLFARVLKWLFTNYHDLTVAALIGLMIGSLRLALEADAAERGGAGWQYHPAGAAKRPAHAHGRGIHGDWPRAVGPDAGRRHRTAGRAQPARQPTAGPG